jgi:DMSO reductase anchor subunit
MPRPISALRGLVPWLTVAAISAVVLVALMRRLYEHDMMDLQDRRNWTLYTAAAAAIGVVLFKRASSLRKLRASGA